MMAGFGCHRSKGNADVKQGIATDYRHQQLVGYPLTMASVTFRNYQAEDHDMVWQTHSACTRQLGFGLGPWDDDFDDIKTKGQFLVVLVDGKIVAYGGYEIEDDTTARVRRLGVHPAYQRRGLGRSLLSEIENHSRHRGIHRLTVDTSIGQVAARGLYKACGFQEVDWLKIGGVDCILFEKIIHE